MRGRVAWRDGYVPGPLFEVPIKVDMTTVESASEPNAVRHRRRHHRALWKRRQFWIALIAIIVAILLVLWLTSNVGVHKEQEPAGYGSLLTGTTAGRRRR